MARSEVGMEQDATSTPRPTGSTCLLIVSMHRSGTSALTRVLSLLGADLPHTLMEGEDANKTSNATGHWESEAAARLGDLILDSAGTDWRSPEPVAASWYRSVRYADMRNRAVAMLQEEFGSSPLFVFKDPRTCKILPFWMDAFDRFGATPRVISIIRSPLEVAASLQARNGFDMTIGQMLWLRYVLDGEAGSRSVPRTYVTYDQLLGNVFGVTDKIATAFDLVWPRASLKTKSAIGEFLSDSHRHHARELDLAAGPQGGLEALLQTVYTIMTGWAREGERPEDWQALDRAREELDRAIALLGGPIHLAIAQGSQLRGLRLQSKEQKALLGATEAKVKALEKSVDRGKEEAALQNARISEARQAERRHAAEAVRAEAVRVEAVDRSQRLQEQLAAEAARAEAARAEAARAEAARVEAVDRSQRFQEQLAETLRGRDALRMKIHARDMEQLRKELQLAAVKGELAGIRGKARQVEAELSKRSRIAEDRQAAIEHLKQDRARKVAERDARNEQLRKRISELRHQLVAAEMAGRKKGGASPFRLLSRALHFRGAQAAATRDACLARLRGSELFDPWWYLDKYEDVRLQGLDPAEHYLDHGGMEGRSPGPGFNGRWYLDHYADVREAGINPLLHYLEYGKLEGREIRLLATKGKTVALSRPPKALPVSATADRSAARGPDSAARQLPDIPESIEDETDWVARPLSFSRLAKAVAIDEDQRSAGLSHTVDSGFAPGGDIGAGEEDAIREDVRHAARAWHAYLGGLRVGIRREESLPAQSPEEAVRRQLCDGSLSLEDAWFGSLHELCLRFRAKPGMPSSSVRLYQQDGEGRKCLCGEATLADDGMSIVRGGLLSFYRPVLLIVVDDAERTLDSMLIVFPSLLRGAPHFGELALEEGGVSSLSAAAIVSLRLLKKYVAAVSGDVRFAVSGVMIDIAGTNGTEPALDKELLSWLSADLGIAIGGCGQKSNHSGMQAILADLEGIACAEVMRDKAVCLYLPFSAVPSLSAIFALEGEVSGDGSHSIHMNAADRLAAYAVDQDCCRAALARLLPLPNVAAPAMVAEEGGVRAPSVGSSPSCLALCWPTAVAVATTRFFPISADVPLLSGAKPSDIRKLSILIDAPEAGDGLIALLATLSALRVDFDIDCILITSAPVAVPRELGVKVRSVRPTAGTPVERFVEAAASCEADRLLLLDEAIVLHDRRIGGLLWEACDISGVGTSSCVLLSEIPGTKGGVRLQENAGWVWMSEHESPARIVKTDMAGYALPACMAVAAPNLGCVMLDKAIFVKYAMEASDELSLGLAMDRDGLTHLCLGFVTATDTVPRFEEERPAGNIVRNERVLHIRTLLS